MSAQRCTSPGEHHSTDTVAVFHGLAEPTILCGYHESRRRLPTPRMPDGTTQRRVPQPVPPA